MKILFLISSLETGGAEKNCIELANHLALQGYDITICTIFHRKTIYHVSEKVHVVCNPLTRYIRPYARFTALFWRLFPWTKPDLIISFMWFSNCLAASMQKMTGIPAILSEQSNPDCNPGPKNMQKQINNVFPFASKIVSLSAGATEIMQKRFSLRDNQIATIPSPVYAFPIQKCPIPAQKPYLLAVGRFHPVKGYLRMIKIFAMVHKEFPEEKLVICGDGAQRQEIEQQIANLHLEDSISLVGIRKDVEAFYQHADALLFTSLFEGQGNVLLEAQACGCPPIAFDCKFGPSAIIQNGKTGIVIPDGDESGMANAIINYLKHPEIKLEFQKNMPEHLKKFSPDNIYKQWINLIKEVNYNIITNNNK